MLKYLDVHDKNKPKFNKLCMLPGFNILDLTNNTSKEPLSYNNEAGNKNSFMIDKDTINEKNFSKLFSLIDSVKKQRTKKSHKKAQRKLTRKH